MKHIHIHTHSTHTAQQTVHFLLLAVLRFQTFLYEYTYTYLGKLSPFALCAYIDISSPPVKKKKKKNSESGFWGRFYSLTTAGPHISRELLHRYFKNEQCLTVSCPQWKGDLVGSSPAELLALGDSQFSYSFPRLAGVLLTQLATDRNICSILYVLDSSSY